MTTTRFGFIDVMKCLAMALIVFGVRAVSASLLALLHLRWLADALKP